MQRKFKLSKYLQQLVENIEFGNGQQYNNTKHTSRRRQIRLVDKSIIDKACSLMLEVIYFIATS